MIVSSASMTDGFALNVTRTRSSVLRAFFDATHVYLRYYLTRVQQKLLFLETRLTMPTCAWHLPLMDEQSTAPDVDPFQELADAETAIVVAAENERRRCADIIQEALEQAALRGLHESSPVVRILAGLKHKIDLG